MIYFEFSSSIFKHPTKGKLCLLVPDLLWSQEDMNAHSVLLLVVSLPGNNEIFPSLHSRQD